MLVFKFRNLQYIYIDYLTANITHPFLGNFWVKHSQETKPRPGGQVEVALGQKEPMMRMGRHPLPDRSRRWPPTVAKPGLGGCGAPRLPLPRGSSVGVKSPKASPVRVRVFSPARRVGVCPPGEERGLGEPEPQPSLSHPGTLGGRGRGFRSPPPLGPEASLGRRVPKPTS